MSEKVALVTGAGSGIGKACAMALSQAGFSLVLSGRRQPLLEEVAEQCVTDALVVPTDVGDETAVAALFEATERRFGRLDLLFNNAGAGSPPKPLEKITADEWRRVIDVNLNGSFFCTQQAFRLMKAQDPQGGRIINNGSISAHAPRPWSAPYTASKHAITGLTKSTSLDGRAFNIVCGQIDIGNALTDLTARMGDGVPQADGSMKPEPTMDVSHVAQAVVQMAELPLASNIQFMTIMASAMPFVGRG